MIVAPMVKAVANSLKAYKGPVALMSFNHWIVQQFAELITAEFGTVDVIAGVATGAIAQGVLVAQELGLPFVYVRSSQKDTMHVNNCMLET